MSLGHGASIVRSGLVLHLDPANKKSYPGTGASYFDMSSAGNNSSLVNSPTFVTSNKGNFSLDGVNGYIDCGATPQIGSSLTGLTTSIWINSSSRTPRCIAENGTTYTTNTFYIFQEDVNYFRFVVYGTNYDAIDANYVYQLNTWYNLVGVWQSGSRLDLYTNGVLTNGSRAGSLQTTVINGNANLHIGNRPGNTSFRFSGSIGPAMFYNRALTASEIQQNFNALRGRYGI